MLTDNEALNEIVRILQRFETELIGGPEASWPLSVTFALHTLVIAACWLFGLGLFKFVIYVKDHKDVWALLLAVLLPCSIATAQDTTTGKVFDWDLFEDSSDTGGSSGAALTVVGSPVLSGERFGGFTDSNYFALPSVASWAGTTERTVSLWVNASTRAASKTAFSMGGGTSGNFFGVYPFSSPQGFVYANGSARASMTAGYPPLSADTHVVVTVDASNNIKMYVDGTLRGSETAAIPFPGTMTGGAVGRWHNGSGQAFHGSIGQVKVFNRALSGSDVAALKAEDEAEILAFRNPITCNGPCSTTWTLVEMAPAPFEGDVRGTQGPGFNFFDVGSTFTGSQTGSRYRFYAPGSASNIRLKFEAELCESTITVSIPVNGEAIVEFGCCGDVDGDGECDKDDCDDDGDGVDDKDEDDDGDGIPNDEDDDDDDDGCKDNEECEDDDEDGIPNCQDPDDDNDGTADWLDCDWHGEGGGCWGEDPDEDDPDDDGVPNDQDWDDDNDGIPDWGEDDDGDGTPNGEDDDDDGDGFPDGPGNPNNDPPVDTDGDGIPDPWDPDDDGDGTPDEDDEDHDDSPNLPTCGGEGGGGGEIPEEPHGLSTCRPSCSTDDPECNEKQAFAESIGLPPCEEDCGCTVGEGEGGGTDSDCDGLPDPAPSGCACCDELLEFLKEEPEPESEWISGFQDGEEGTRGTEEENVGIREEYEEKRKSVGDFVKGMAEEGEASEEKAGQLVPDGESFEFGIPGVGDEYCDYVFCLPIGQLLQGQGVSEGEEACIHSLPLNNMSMFPQMEGVWFGLEQLRMWIRLAFQCAVVVKASLAYLAIWRSIS